MKRTIQELRDLKTGNELIADEWLVSMDESQQFDLRRKLKRDYKENKAHLVCAICNSPVYLAGNSSQELYFKHWKELGDCPIKTKGKFSQKEINCMKYNGARESRPHREIKEHLYKYFSNHPSCSNVNIEKVVRSKITKGEWKKPDISLKLNDTMMVVEIQLSTTYLDVIVDRDLFYEQNNIYILWVFDEKEIERFRFTEKDIFYDNKRNSFLVTAESKKRSRETGTLHLLCYYQKPYPSKGRIKHKWAKEFVSINQLKLDAKKHKIYFFDYDKQIALLQPKLDEFLCQSFKQYLIKRKELNYEQKEEQDAYFIKKFNKRGIAINKFSHKLLGILNATYSVKYGHMVGYNFPNLVGLSNMILEQRPEFTHFYLWALAIFGKRQEVENIPSFKKKVENYKKEKPEQNSEFNALFKFLFPELASKIP